MVVEREPVTGAIRPIVKNQTRFMSQFHAIDISLNLNER